MKSTSLIIVLVMTMCMCAVLCSLMSGATIFIMNPTNVTPGLQPESITYDSIPRAGGGCVVLYDHSDGKGKNHTVCLDGQKEFLVRNLKNESFNDITSSVDVGPGVKVTLYKDADQKGESYVPQTGFTNLNDVWKNDTVSSLWLRQA